MSDRDSKFLNKSEDHELNTLLRNNGFRETEQNRKVLKEVIPNYSTQEKAKEVINQTNVANKLEKKEK